MPVHTFDTPALTSMPPPQKELDEGKGHDHVLKWEKQLDMLTRDKCTHSAIVRWGKQARSVQGYCKLPPSEFVMLCWRRLGPQVQADLSPLFPETQLTPISFEKLYEY